MEAEKCQWLAGFADALTVLLIESLAACQVALMLLTPSSHMTVQSPSAG